MFYLLIFGAGLFDALSSIILRLWIDDRKIYLLVAGVLGFAIMGVFFALSMQYKGLALANIICVGLATVLLAAIAMTSFKEHLGIIQIVGIIVVLVGVVLIGK